MLRLLPVVLVLLVIGGGLIYFRFATSSNVVSPKSSSTTQTEDQAAPPKEVPKELPKLDSSASLEDRVKNLENTISTSKSSTNTTSDTRLKDVEAAVTELKVRVSSLEKASPVPVVSSGNKTPLYIPLGSAGQISDTNWNSLGGFQASLDPAQYAGYANMQLEVTIRLNQPGGTAYARLYNSSASSAVSSEVSTTSTSATIGTSSGFTLSSGAKTYILQAKSSDGSQVFIDNARIKVNF